ncbi:hypothetical protein niasHT_008396 [Heterodera trifolii]|uniref:Uncharacterized protein n=1 Tax=Heterodera trifolii TaxID=157864 RepID=A0ABD2LP67_9BILA
MDEKYLEACKPACKSLSEKTCYTIKVNTFYGTSHPKILCFCEWKTEGCVPKDPPSNDVATANSGDQ